MKKMKALMFYEPMKVKYEEVAIDDIGDDEVLVKIEAALSCGTDIKTYKRGHPVLIPKTPSGFGHEFSGIVEEVGKNVKNFKPGNRVVAANSAPCGECYFCRHQEYNLCESLLFLNGAYAEYIKIPARIVQKNLLIIPDNIDFEEAAFAEPLANVVHGIDKTGIREGQTVGIIGLGPIGLMLARMAKLKGAKVIACGRNPLKLKLAKEFAGADEVVDLKNTLDAEDHIRSLTPEGKGLDIIIEAVGLPEVWEAAFRLVRKGGTVHLFGGCKSGTKVSLDTKRLHYDEIKVISVFHHTPKYFKQALSFIESKMFDVKKLITHRMSFSDFDEAVKLYDEGKAIKISFHS